MIQEPFAEGRSRIHDMDPRARIILAVIFSFIVALSENMETLIAALVIAAALDILAGFKICAVLRRLRVILAFMLLLWILLPFSHQGEPLFTLGPFGYSLEGVWFALSITLKSVSILLAFLALIGSMTISTLGCTLNWFHISPKLVYLLLLTYRYLFVLESEFQRLMRSAKVRGFSPGTNMHSFRTFAYLLGMLFVRASLRSERVHLAMKCRGFNGRFFTIYSFRGKRSTRFMVAALGLAVIGLAALELGVRIWTY